LQYWLVVLTPLPVMGGVWGLMRLHVLWRMGWQTHLGLTHPTDIPWSPTSTLVYPAIVITVGVMAGMLGLGGGIVLVSGRRGGHPRFKRGDTPGWGAGVKLRGIR
jgi:uncharacterized membrane protein YfcA